MSGTTEQFLDSIGFNGLTEEQAQAFDVLTWFFTPAPDTRAAGRTTVAILVQLKLALDNPEQSIWFRDHRGRRGKTHALGIFKTARQWVAVHLRRHPNHLMRCLSFYQAKDAGFVIYTPGIEALWGNRAEDSQTELAASSPGPVDVVTALSGQPTNEKGEVTMFVAKSRKKKAEVTMFVAKSRKQKAEQEEGKPVTHELKFSRSVAKNQSNLKVAFTIAKNRKQKPPEQEVVLDDHDLPY